MNLLNTFTRYPDQEACIEHLEKVRWGDDPYCPHCGSLHVARKNDGHRMGRWNCHDCKSSFNVLSGTIFEKTKVPLKKWFMAIGLTVSAKKRLSSCQLARDLDLSQPTAWYMQHRIRAQIASGQESILLQGVVEVGGPYAGAKPLKLLNLLKNQEKQPPPPSLNPWGRGTKKNYAANRSPRMWRQGCRGLNRQ